MRLTTASVRRFLRAATLWTTLPFVTLTLGIALVGYAVYFALVWVIADIIYEVDHFNSKVFGEEADKS